MPPLLPRPRRIALAVAAATLSMAMPAAAHPFIRGGEAPVASLATLTLDLAHGCASETAGAGDDTLEVALEVPDWLQIVEAPAPEGWAVDLEQEAGAIAVVSWVADGAPEPAPVFTFDAVIEGEPGDERYLSVFQSCEDRVHRWIGTPQAPADEPAVRLRLAAADPDRPPPPPGGTAVDGSDTEGPEAGSTPDAAGDPPEEGPPPRPTGGADTAGGADPGDGTDAVAASADDRGAWWPAVAAALALALGGWLAIRLRRQESV